MNWTPVGQYGMVSVSSTGDVTIQVSGAQPRSSYPWSFCPLLGGCFDLGQILMTDASGNGQVTFHFPKTGNWAGYFSAQAGTSVIDTQDAAHVAMTSILVNSNGLNGSAPCTSGNCGVIDPGHGSVTVANGSAHIVITGGLPNHTYEVVLQGGGTTQGSMTTDASGNATADLAVTGGHGATYVLDSLVSGFTVK